MKIPTYLTVSLAFLWLWSGLQPALTAPDASLQLLADIGIATPWRRPLFYAASAWDVLLGILILTPLRRLPAWPAGPLPSRMLKSAAVMPAGRLACPAGHTGAYRAPVPCTPWSSHRAGGGSPAWHARRHGPTSVGAMIFPWPPGVVLPSFFVLSPYP